jgi:hypothetical protein
MGLGYSNLIQTLSQLMSFFMLAGLVMLWWRTGRSPWLLAAWIAQLVGIACRIAVQIVPNIVQQYPAFMGTWQLTYAVMALGVFVYALTLPKRNATQDPLL